MSRPEMAVGAVPVAAARRFPLIHVLLLATTTLTTAMASSLFQGFDPIDDPRQLVHGVPFAATLITILLVHESGHYLMCLRHGVAASMPYFLPAPPNIFPLGTFGAFIRIRSRFPDRRALFDIGAAGPWGGFVVAVAAMVVGLRLSTVLPAPPMEHTLELGDSLLTTFLTRSVLGTDPDVVMLHPVAFAGWVGLFITSLNLLPAGQLDGGHVLYAVADGARASCQQCCSPRCSGSASTVGPAGSSGRRSSSSWCRSATRRARTTPGRSTDRGYSRRAPRLPSSS